MAIFILTAFGAVNTTTTVQTGGKQYATPTAGATVTVTTANILVLNPSGTLATLTVVLPSSPSDGYSIAMCCSQIVTTLTLTSAKTVNGGIAAFAANGFAQYIFDSTADQFFRVG